MNVSPALRVHFSLTLAAAWLALAPALRAAEITAVQSGPWSDPATWGGTVPGVSDTAINPGFSIGVDGDYAVAGIQLLSSGTFNGTGNLTASGNLVWHNASFSNGGLTIGAGATASLGSILGGGYEILYVGSGTVAVNNFGDVTVSAVPSAQWGLYDNGAGSALWNNKNGSQFTLTGCASIAGTNVSVFNNEAGATFRHTGNTAGNNVSTVRWSVVNNGLVNAQEGTLVMESNTLSGSGTYTAALGATLVFNNSVLATNATVTGAGVFSPTGTITGNGTLHLNGNTTWLTDGAFNNPGGVVFGANATAQIGTTASGGYQNIYSSAGPIAANNFGAVTVATIPGAQWGLYDNSVGNTTWNNKSGSQFTLTGCASIIGSSASVFNNEAGATFRHTGSTAGDNVSSVRWSLVNNGAVNVDAGTLVMESNTLSGNGTYTAAPGATLVFNNTVLATNTTVTGTGTFMPTGTITGNGALHLNGTTTWLTDGAFNNPGGVVFGANATAQIGTTASGGYQNIYSSAGPIAANNFGTVTVATIPGAQWGLYDNSVGNTTWNNKIGSQFTLTGCASIIGSSASVFNNEAGATFRHTGNTAGDNVSSVHWSFFNNGALDVQEGVLQFSQGTFGGTSGTVGVAANATLQFSQETIAANTTVGGSGVVSLVNDVTLQGATQMSNVSNQANVIGAGHLTVTQSLEWLNIFAQAGGLTIGANATATLGSTTAGGYEILYAGGSGTVANNFGNATAYSPAGTQWGLYDNSSGTTLWNNKSGSRFTLTGCASIIGSSSSQFVNEAGATFRHAGGQAGNNASYVQWSFINHGAIEVQEGLLQFSSTTFSGQGTASVAANATLEFSAVTIGANTSVGGSGLVTFTSTSTLTGPAQFGHVRLNGNLQGAGNLTVTDSLAWLGGFIQDGTLTIGANVTATLGAADYSNYQYFYNSTTGTIANNFGNVTVLSPNTTNYGLYDAGTGTSVWNNKSGSQFTLTGCASIVGAPASLFNNEAGALLVKAGGDPGSITWTLNNQGTLSVNGGTLDLEGPVAQSDAGNSTLTGGTWVVNANSTLTFPGSSSFTTIGENATVTLHGPNSVFAAVESVTTIFGGLQISGGREFSKAVNFGVFNGSLHVSEPGSLFATTEQIAVFGGLVSVTDGGSMSLHALDLGNGGASVASVGLGAGTSTLTVGNVLVGSGVGGNATLNIHSGGLVQVTDFLMLSASEGVPATVTLNSGGMLQVGGLSGLTNTFSNYTFNWNGGTIRVAGSNLTTAINFHLGDAVTNSGFDTNGFNALLSGNLAGDNALTKLGLGTLTLTGNSSHEGTYVRAGTLALDGGTASLSHSGPLGVIQVGVADGDTASFLVQNGAEAVAFQAILGVAANSTGNATVAGANSSLSTSDNLIVGDYGTGSLTVTSGGTVVGGSAYLGLHPTGNGTVLVTGANSTLAITQALLVGDQGLGSLTVENGGGVTAGSILLGNSTTGNGTGLVTGTNSTLAATSNLTVGQAGLGSLTISNGGTVTTGNNSFLGATAAGNGTVLVTGANSQWNFLGSDATINIGTSGTGSLTLADGGSLTVKDGNIGGPGGNGSVLITGTNSTWQYSTLGTVTVGQNGPGQLTITDHASASLWDVDVGVGAAGQITVSGGGNFSASDTVHVGGLGGSGTVLVTGNGSFFNNGGGYFFVGENNPGNVTVTDGGTLRTRALAILNGTITITGNGSKWELGADPFDVGDGQVSILNGAVAEPLGTTIFSPTFNSSASTASLVVDGSGSRYQVLYSIFFGTTGKGNLTVSGGGNASIESATLGANTTGNGTVLVTGANSTFHTSGNVFVGQSGLGSFTVANSGAAAIGANVYLGFNPTGNGTAEITDPGSTWSYNFFNVGVEGRGSLTVANGAALSGSESVIGHGTTGNGTALVTGAGSSWTVAGDLYVGLAGKGGLTVTNGGHLGVSGMTLVGSASAGNGTLTITGPNSTASSSGPLFVGQAGLGSLNVTHGGALTTNGGTVGVSANSTGTVMVNSAAWNAGAANLTFGEAGFGSAFIETSGNLSGNIIKLGRNATGSGLVQVAGNNALLHAGGALYIGESGTGNLSILSSATVTNSGNAWIGFNAGSTGTVTVLDATWASNASIIVGDHGTGALTIDDGGLVSLGSGFPLLLGTFSGANGTVQLKPGGTLQVSGADGILAGTGNYAFNWNGGTVKVSGSNFTTAINAVLTSNATAIFDSNSLSNTWSGVLSGSGSFQKSGLGTLTLTSNNTYTGATTVTAGSLVVSGASARINSPAANLTVGTTGAANLTVSGGGNVTANNTYLGLTAGSNGTMVAQGSNSKVNTGILYVGYNGAGNMIISGGANVTSVSSDSVAAYAAFVGGAFNGTNDTGAGSVIVDGPGSHWSVQDILLVGVDGTGALTVTNGGTVTTEGITRAAVGPDSFGSILVTGPGSVLSASGVTIASATLGGGGNGTLTVSNGGVISTFLGSVSGIAVITGAGSAWNLTGSDFSVGTDVGDTGTMNIRDGGQVRSAGGRVGDQTATGFVTISGAGSAWTSTGTISVGRTASHGTITVTNGGTLITNALSLGSFSIADGTLVISGASSSVTTGTMSSGLLIGAASNGTVTVTAGGALITNGAQIGNSTSGKGVALVTGANSTWNGGTQRIFAGVAGVANLTVADGGTVSSQGLTVGQAATGNGTVTIIGVGSALNSGSQSFIIGQNGKGTVTIADGGALLAASGIVLAQNITGNGTLNLDAMGTLQIGGMNGIQKGAGNATLTLNGGTIKVTGSDFTTAINATLIPSVTASVLDTNGFNATWTGIISGSDSFAKNGNGTLILGGNNTMSGLVGVLGGILQVGAGSASGALGTASVQNNSTLVFNRAGTLAVSGNIFGPGTLTNAGPGTVNLTGNNTYTGATAVNTGTLTAINGLNGTASITVANGAHLGLGGASSTGTLTLNGGNLTLNSSVTVGGAYANADFGTGNAFDAHAHVSGNGTINAAGDTAQVVLGANVTGGSTSTPSITFPSIHEGETVTRSYAIANNGTTGPQLQGAIQNTTVTDPRLSGTGVTAQNWGPLGPGAATGNYSVTLNGTTPGALAPNQTVGLVNNFDNVLDQALSLQGGSVYRYAVASNITGNLSLGDFHENDPAVQALAVTNEAAASGGYTEALAGIFSAETGAALGFGAFTELAPGNTSNALSVSLNTTSPGAKSGSATYNFHSLAVNGSGLGNSTLAPQTVNITGNVYRLAGASALPLTVDFGSLHENDLASLIVTVSNDAAASGGFTESLAGSFSAATGSATGSGNFTNLGPGNTSTALVVGLNTATTGARSGSATFGFTSQAVAGSTLGNTTLPPQTVPVTGNIYRYASATAQAPTVDLGIVHIGDVVVHAYSIANTAGATGGFTENLGVAVGSVAAGLSANGSITGLGPSSPASTNISITLNTSVAGGISNAPVTLDYTSQALAGSGLGNTSLPSQTTLFTATVNHFADPTFSKVSGDGDFSIVGPELVVLNFGNVTSSAGPLVANLRLTNAALAPADWLAGNFTISNPSGQFIFGGFTAFDDLQAGQFLSLTVTFLTTANGNFSGNVTLAALSENAGGFSGNMGNFVLQVEGAVPEPAACAAILGALVLAAAALRRRHR